MPAFKKLNHWGQVTHICASELSTISSDNGLSPGRRQAIILTNAGTLLIRPLGTHFSESFIKINIFSLKKMHLNALSAKCWPFCLSLNVLIKNSPLSLHHDPMPSIKQSHWAYYTDISMPIPLCYSLFHTLLFLITLITPCGKLACL